MSAGNSILKLRVESEEYDAKLKKAAEGIQHLAEVAHRGGGELTGLEKAELDYIRAIGDMETKSRSAAGRTRELENAFKELTVIYNNLNDVEKADEGGKALAASLETLKKRALDAKEGLDKATKALKENEQAANEDKSVLDGLSSAFGINIKSLMGWGAALAAGKVALDVAKDAFMSSETNVDEWGRTVESAKGIYEGFLQALNTGDISGFLSNINQITAAAKDAYNALDELGTRQTILNPERAKLQARQTELKATIRREGADSEAGKAATKELKALEKPLTDAWKTESKLNRDAFEALVRERLAEGGINLNKKSFDQFMKTFSSDSAYQNLRKNAKGSIVTEYTGGGSYDEGSVQKVDTRNTEKKLLDLFTDEWRKQNSGYLSAAYNAQGSAASVMLSDSRYVKETKPTGGNKQTKQEADELQKVQQKIAKLTKEAYTADSKRVEEIQAEIAGLQEEERRLTVIRDLVTNKNNDPLKAIESQFPDMSKQNYNTGYAGSAQSKYDSARQGFALGGISTSDISGFINLTKQAIAQSDIGSEMYTKLTEQMKDATTMSTLLNEMMERGVEGTDLTTMAEKMKAALLEGDIPDEKIKEFIEQMNEKIREQGGVELEYNGQTGEVKDKKSDKKDEDDLKKFNESVGKLTGGMSQVTNGLKAVGVQIPKEVDDIIGVINGVSQIITGVGTIISIFGTSAMTANTTAVTLNTTSIGALIAAIEVNTATNLIPGLSGGGMAFGGKILHAATGTIVPGNYGFDAVPAMLTSGEVVLNHAQVGNLASQLEDNGRGATGGNTQPYLDGEKIYLGLQAYTRRSGLGEIVTSER